MAECETLANALQARCPEFRTLAHPSWSLGRIAVRPDLVLVALESASFDADAFTEQLRPLRSALDGVPVVVLAEDDHTIAASAALFRQGVSGCLSYSAGLEGLTKMLWLVLRGGVCFPRECLAGVQPDEARQGPEAPPPPPAEPEVRPAGLVAGPGLDARLTQRECEVVRKLRLGKPNKIIAYELGISISTVKVHLRNIMRKTGATNRVEAALRTDPGAGAPVALRT
jgi:two-component system nitrate/nitrite response regulator NarL